MYNILKLIKQINLICVFTQDIILIMLYTNTHPY